MVGVHSYITIDVKRKQCINACSKLSKSNGHQGRQDEESTFGVNEGNGSRQAFDLVTIAMRTGNISFIAFVEPLDRFGHVQ